MTASAAERLVCLTDARVAEYPAQQLVNFSDLDLTMEEGIEQLYRRIRDAARKIYCKPDRLKLLEVRHARLLAEKATARAIASVNAPALTRYYETRGRSVYYHDAM